MAVIAVTLGGVIVVQATSAQANTRDWGFVDISDPDTTYVTDYGSYPGKALSFKNPTNMELYCYAQSGPVEYIQPQFSPWVQEGISLDEAEELQRVADDNYSRARAQKDVYLTNGVEDYIAPGETREIGFQSLRPGDAVFLECGPQSQLGHYNLFGYGTVQDDLSVKSSIPVDDNEFPLPVTTPPVTMTEQVPTTVRETTTVTTTVAPATVTETITQEPTTRTVSVTAAPVTVTTTRASW